MRVMILSQTGYGMGLTHHLTDAGHNVDECLMTMPSIPFINGMLSKFPDIAVLDAYDFNSQAEYIRSKGIKVLGQTSWSKVIATNGEYKANLISAMGFKAADAKSTGIPITFSCWFNGDKIISRYLVFNYPKLMAGNVGPDVGCAGYVAYFGVENSKLVKEVTEAVEKFLRKIEHQGFFSVCLLVGEKGYVVADISCSLTDPWGGAVFENTTYSKYDIISSCIDKTSKPIKSMNDWVCSVMLSMYPYPNDKPEVELGIEGINHFNMKHMWLVDIERTDSKFFGGKNSGMLGYVTSRGVSVEESRRRVYRSIDNLTIPDVQYRNDVGKDVNEKMFKLRQNGWV